MCITSITGSLRPLGALKAQFSTRPNWAFDARGDLRLPTGAGHFLYVYLSFAPSISSEIRSFLWQRGQK